MRTVNLQTSNTLITFVILLPILLLSAGGESLAAKLYTAHNLWFETPKNFFVISYKRGELIPAGTEITDLEVSRSDLEFKIKDKEYRMRFNRRFHPGETTKSIAKRLFSTKTRKELLAGMTAEEQDGVQRGTPVLGMTKEEVIVAFGYPPTHETPSLTGKKWKYWLNRFGTMTICFNKKERAIRCHKKNDLWIK